MEFLGKRRGRLPGFGLTMGMTVSYLSLMVLIPLSALVIRAASTDAAAFWAVLSSPRVMAAYRLTLGTSLVAALVNAFFGLVVAWVLVRDRFPGRMLVDSLVDLPFALPTAVAGIVLTTLLSPAGWLGKPLAQLGVSVAFTRLGIIVALTFVGLPFVVRTLQPVLESLDPEVEEAARSLGASRWQIVRRIVLPAVLPAWLTGFALAFARGLGEYGSVVFIAGNMPMKTEIAPLLIMSKLEQYDLQGATVIAVVLLGISFVLLLAINRLQTWAAQRGAGAH